MAYKSTPIYLLNPVLETKEITTSIEKFLEEWIPRHSSKEDLTLFHYTTLDGLKGILEERSIWLSHMSTLNDPLELQYGKKVVADIINDIIREENRAEVRRFYHSLLVQVNAFGTQVHHAFVACFCETEDLLSQWREYSDKGGGYSLGFKFSLETKISLVADKFKNIKIPMLRKVIYDKELQIDIVKKYLELINTRVLTVLDRNNIPPQLHDKTHLASVTAMEAANILLDMIMTFKHPAFRIENEWRLIYVTMSSFKPENLKFRDKLVPYHSFNIYNSEEDGSFTFPVNKINFGPTFESANTRSSIILYIEHIAKKENDIKILPHLLNVKGTDYQLKT